MAIRVFVSWVFAALALFSKETAITVVVINLAYDFSCVCKLDVLTFLTMIVTSVTGSSSKAVDKKPAKPTPSDKQEADGNQSAHMPRVVRQFIVRAVVTLAMLAWLLKFRLSLNRGEDRQHAPYNRLSFVIA